MNNQKCYLCDRPAVVFCDGLVEDGTCDRPMCRDHVEASMPYIACFTDGRSTSNSQDYCSECNALAGFPHATRIRILSMRRNSKA